MNKMFLILSVFFSSCMTVSDTVSVRNEGLGIPSENLRNPAFQIKFENERQFPDAALTKEYQIIKNTILERLGNPVEIQDSDETRKSDSVSIFIFGRMDKEKSSVPKPDWVSAYTAFIWPTKRTKVYELTFMFNNNKKKYYQYEFSKTTYTSILFLPFFWISNFTDNTEKQMNGVMDSFLSEAERDLNGN